MSNPEPWMLDLLKTLSPLITSTFVDVGVNIGQTLLKFKSIFPNSYYLGFEPNLVCFNYLENLIKLNKLSSVKVLPLGISNKTNSGILYLFNNNDTDPSASIIDGFRQKNQIKKQIDIQLSTWSDVKHKFDFKNISVLKIDVEGAELEVLRSFEKDLKKYSPIIIIEILPVYNIENELRIKRQNSVQELVLNLDYVMFRVVKEKKRLLKFEQVEVIGIHENINDCDYVMVPKQKLRHFNKLIV
ncbi:FkbM family methyltransferase [Neotamlana sedimentorum]|uniref:FkbM family methyltransferase n=1 Tax=Neotamlana sedimentorum TaxID=1435349 RepID=UPI0013F4498C|nr:FkbM family methyltransferase [Tamlana sedimentorum]